jgi:hypothetical protein
MIFFPREITTITELYSSTNRMIFYLREIITIVSHCNSLRNKKKQSDILWTETKFLFLFRVTIVE